MWIHRVECKVCGELPRKFTTILRSSLNAQAYAKQHTTQYATHKVVILKREG